LKAGPITTGSTKRFCGLPSSLKPESFPLCSITANTLGDTTLGAYIYIYKAKRRKKIYKLNIYIKNGN